MTVTVRYPKRLIEVDLPIKRISAHSRREKNIRHGHISTLHVWWARRPLAACRSVILATLWPDPADPECPARFLACARQQMSVWANTHAAKSSAESFDRLVRIQKDPEVLDDPVEVRRCLLDFIADFANWDHANDPDYLAVSRTLVQAAHEALSGANPVPVVVDPFAGGGAIPLEALRVGATAFASDLNPLAVLLNRIVLERLPQAPRSVGDDVRRWGAWVRERVMIALRSYYPVDADGSTPIAYLWARTILSEAPGQAGEPIEVPLMRSNFLAKRAGGSWALRWKRDSAGTVETERHRIEYVDGSTRDVQRPMMELFRPASNRQVPPGTVARGSATCPVSGFTTSVVRVRAQLSARRGGADDARLLAVVCTNPRQGSRFYRLPTSTDEAVARGAGLVAGALPDLEGGLPAIPHEPLPPQGTLGFRVQPYGITQWGSLYSRRQALALATFCSNVRDARANGCPDLVCDLLALAVGRLQDLNSSLATWANTIEAVCGANRAQNRLSMVWDFVEPAPLGGAGGDWMGQVEWVARVCEHITQMGCASGVVASSPAQIPVWPEDSADMLFTDPPYYNAFAYSDLSDIFLAWLKRAVSDPKAKFGLRAVDSMSPKEQEIVVNPGASADGRGSMDRPWFESQMEAAFAAQRLTVRPGGIGTIVFAHKDTSSWEALLSGVIRAGWMVSASWPLDTERASRQRAQGSAALASSIHLVCRPRENPDGSIAESVGDWRDVLDRLPKRIHEWMPRLASEGVVGADAIFACLGPALEEFSKYSRVEKASGDRVDLGEYLEHVWAAVAKEALSVIFAGAETTGFEEDARLTAMWLWTLSTASTSDAKPTADEANDDEPDEEDEAPVVGGTPAGFALTFDAARKIAQGLGAHLEDLRSLVEVKGETARLLPVGERTKMLFGRAEAEGPPSRQKKAQKQMLLGFVEELEKSEEVSGWGPKGVPDLGKTVLDRLHQAMILFAAGRGEALRRFLVDEGAGRDARLWGLAQALAALYPAGTEERRWVEGVLARKKSLGF